MDPGELLAMQWSHSVTFEETFQCEYRAREAAQKLALEIELDGRSVCTLKRTPSPQLRSSLRTRTSNNLRVGFADLTSLLLGDDEEWRMFEFQLPDFYFACESTPWSGCPLIAEMRASRFHVQPWHSSGLVRSCLPATADEDTPSLLFPFMVDQCKIIDNHIDNPARHARPAPDEPDPDEIPDIAHAPHFAQDLQAIADEQDAFTDPDGDGILRLRTWYLHHEHHLVNFHSRIVELEDDWRRWENDIIGSWRTHLQAGASIFFHLVFPDPYRGYLRRRVHGDIIITQGNDIPRRACLITVHYHGRQAEPHSYALASSLELVVSGRRLTETADADQWCNFDSHRCTITHGWDRIPRDHRPTHQLQNGHSFDITVYASSDEQSRQRAVSHATPTAAHIISAEGDIDYDEFVITPQQDATPSRGSSSASQGSDNEAGVHIYRLERPDGHCFLQWSSYQRILFEISRCLLLRRNDIIGYHLLQALPVGLQEQHEQAVILQSILDISPGSREQLILMDLEIHFHALPDGLLIPPALTRKVVRILPPLHRSQILLLNGLLDYCELQGDHCTIYHNYDLWHSQDRTLHEITHGAYIRVIVPPPTGSTLNTETAIAISRDFALEAHQQFYRPECRARGPHDIHQGDTSVLFQTSQALSSSRGPSPNEDPGQFLLKVAPEHVSHPGLLGTSSSGDAPHDHRPRPMTRFHDRDFETLQNLFQSQSLIECEEEGQTAYVDTWYVHHSQHPRCAEPRAVKLFQDSSTWLEDLLMPWNEILDEQLDILLFLVRPKPPCTMMECILAHIIIEQAPRPDCVVGLISKHDSRAHSLVIDHTAWSLPSIMNSNSVLGLAEVRDICRLDRCEVRQGAIPFGFMDFDEVEPGTNLVIFISSGRSTPPWALDHPEHDLHELLQTSMSRPQAGIEVNRAASETGRSESFAFNPAAARFCTGRAQHPSAPASVQDLQNLWTHSTFSWEGEETSLTVETWFVDQHLPALATCWQSRLVRLLEDAQNWENTLRRAWHDRQISGAPILISVIYPSPPRFNQQSSAHVILIQNPQDGLASFLLTAFDTERPSQGPSFQFATTKNEQLALEDIVQELGLFQRCLSPQAASICAAWFDTRILALGMPTLINDGAGIIFQVSRRPTLQEWQAHFGGVNLLQTSAVKTSTKRGRLTHGLVAHTHGPPSDSDAPLAGVEEKVPIHLVCAADGIGPLPSYIEIPGPPSRGNIVQELSAFGVHSRVALLSDDFTALVWPASQPTLRTGDHFVYVSKSQPHAVFLHSFEPSAAVGELDHMKHLYLLGFEKAVILKVIEHETDIVEVVFTESIGTLQQPEAPAKKLPAWPSPQPQRQLGLMFQTQDTSEKAKCNLNVGIGIDDLHAFFTSSKDTLCTSFDGLDLPDLCTQKFATLAQRSRFDRLVIYTDGSSQTRHRHVAPELNEELDTPDSWCFLVVGETYLVDGSSDLTLVGWNAHQVRCGDHPWSLGADRTGSAISEREALTWAMLWRIGQNSNIPTTFRSDSLLALHQAQGAIGAASCDRSFQTLRGCAQLLDSALGDHGLLFDHVPGHAGDPFNEFCDHIAKMEGRKGFYLRRPRIDLSTWQPIIPFLWMLFDTQAGVPQFQGGGFDVGPPSLPPVEDPMPPPPLDFSMKTIDFTISFATGNVQSIGRGEQGFAGKLGFLRSQLAALHLNFMGLQETRADEGASLQQGILRLSSGSTQGQQGVELWCNLKQPFAIVAGKEVFFQRRHFRVAHRDPRSLLVRLQHELLEAWILVAYAPHSGYSSSDRLAWWTSLKDILLNSGAGDAPLFVCIDANAGIGEPDGMGVFRGGFRTSSGTRFLRDFMHEFQLSAPITSEKHTGPVGTWTSPSGEDFTIDYVLIPADWMDRCHRSTILEDFDMGNKNLDHSAYALEICWTSTKLIQKGGRKAVGRFDRTLIQRNMPTQLKGICVSDWHTDVEKHLHCLNSHLHQQLQRSCPRPAAGPRRPYINDTVWSLRRTKLHHRKQLRLTRHLLRRETLARVFYAWRTPQDWRIDASFDFRVHSEDWSPSTWHWSPTTCLRASQSNWAQQESGPL